MKQEEKTGFQNSSGINHQIGINHILKYYELLHSVNTYKSAEMLKTRVLKRREVRGILADEYRRPCLIRFRRSCFWRSDLDPSIMDYTFKIYLPIREIYFQKLFLFSVCKMCLNLVQKKLNIILNHLVWNFSNLPKLAEWIEQ